MMQVTLGQRLRQLRKQAGLNQRDLAEEVGIDFTYLSKIENNKVEPPSEAVLNRLASFLAGRLSTSERILADELILLASKLPSDLAKMISDHPFVVGELRRSLSGDVKTQEDWHRYFQNAKGDQNRGDADR